MNLEGAFKSGDNCRYYSHSDTLTTPQLHSRSYNHTKATFKILQSHYRYYSHISGHNSEGLQQVLPGWSSIPSTIVSFFMLPPTEIGILIGRCDRTMKRSSKLFLLYPYSPCMRHEYPGFIHYILLCSHQKWLICPAGASSPFPSTLFFLSWTSL